MHCYAPEMGQTFAGFHRTEVAGVPVLWLPDHRFKTFCFNLSVRRPLDDRAAARSVLPHLLMQGTAHYPDRPALARQMEALYGAMVAPGTAKEGEVHVLRFGLDCVSGEYLPDRPDQLRAGLEFLAEYLASPRLDGDGFPADVFARERRQALHDARAVFDDKSAWAAERSLALACADEPMAIPEHGGVAAIEALTRIDPERARADFLGRGEMLFVGMGALPGDDEFLAGVAEFLSHLPSRSPEAIAPSVQRVPTGRRAAVERAELQQSKMVMIFRLSIVDEPRTWMGRALFASMLGGGPHSRLFREVREKRSLAYYAQSALERHKGLLVVHVGLDESAAEEVEAETMRQVAALAKGEFRDEELETARAGILSTITALTDGIRSHMRYVEDQWNLGYDRTPQDLFEGYRSMTAEQVARSVEDMQLDFSYLLAPAGEAGR